jgi:2-methylcitrate dehydratase PrpD
VTINPKLSRRGFVSVVAAIATPFLLCRPIRAWADSPSHPALARRLADYICQVRFDSLPRTTVDRAKEELLYHVGLAFSGAKTPAARQSLALAQTLSRGCDGVSTIIGHARRMGPLEAAFANASYIRALGLDDVLFPSATHAGLLTFPAALAIAEQQRSSGREFLAAVILGYELLGKLVVDEDASRAPHRPSMPFGPFAGATAAARLLRLTPAQTANAIGYAADAAMGLKEGNEQQPTHIYGLIARHAIMATLLARAGGDTAPTILEGKYGFYATLIGRQPIPDLLVASLGRDPEILRATQKRFPGTAMNIVPVEIVLSLVQEHHLTASIVDHVEIELPEDRSTFEDSIATGPYATRTQAESSIPFQVAIILLDGRIEMSRYAKPNLPEVMALTKRVFIHLAPHSNSRFARVTISTRDGKRFGREGESYVFPPLDALVWLAKDGTDFVPRQNLEQFVSQTRHLERVADITELMDLLRPT